MKIYIEYNNEQLKKLIVKDLEEKLNSFIKPEDIIIEVKSKQNYKSEWESALYRAIYNGEL